MCTDTQPAIEGCSPVSQQQINHAALGPLKGTEYVLGINCNVTNSYAFGSGKEKDSVPLWRYFNYAL